MIRKVFDHVLQIKIQMARLQADLDDYKKLVEMPLDEVEVLLADLTRKQIQNPWDKSGTERLLRIQNVLSGRS